MNFSSCKIYNIPTKIYENEIVMNTENVDKIKQISTENNDFELKNMDIKDTEIKDTEIIDTEIIDTEIIDTEINYTEICNSIQDDGTDKFFYWNELNESVIERITGKSFPSDSYNIEISYEDLAFVHVLYYNFKNEVCEGEIVCNKIIANDLVEIFEELFYSKYQIEKIKLIDEYDADDMKSMADNNTSAFNYRLVSGTNRLSNHSYGLAIDINPLYNPYIFTRNGQRQVQPYNASDYVNREKDFEHKIDHNDLCYKLFIEHGFTWGGDWHNSKDYQHFEKIN